MRSLRTRHCRTGARSRAPSPTRGARGTGLPCPRAHPRQPRGLRLVHLAATRLCLVLDPAQRETVPNPEAAQVIPETRTSPQLLFHLSRPPTAALRCSRPHVIHYTLEPTLRRFRYGRPQKYEEASTTAMVRSHKRSVKKVL